MFLTKSLKCGLFALLTGIAMSKRTGGLGGGSPHEKAHRRALAAKGFEEVGPSSSDDLVAFLVGYQLEFDEQELLAMSLPESNTFRQFHSFNESRSKATSRVIECQQNLETWINASDANIEKKVLSPFGEYLELQGTVYDMTKLLKVQFMDYLNGKTNLKVKGTSESPFRYVPENVKECIGLFSLVKHNDTRFPVAGAVTPLNQPGKTTRHWQHDHNESAIITPRVLSDMFSLPAAQNSSAEQYRIKQAFFQDPTLYTVDVDDLASFQNHYNVNSTPIANVYGSITDATHKNTSSTPRDESNLDSQYLSAMNPGQLDMVNGPWVSADSHFASNNARLSYYVAATENIPMIISVSYGNGAGPDDPMSLFDEISQLNLKHYCTEMGIAAMRGVTVFFSTGDDGAGADKQCMDDFSYGATNYACPYVTMVGATTGYKAGEEVVAQADKTSGITTGGGFSFAFTDQDYDLSWQSDAVQGYLNQTDKLKYNRPAPGFQRKGRAFPDITAPGTNYCVVINGEKSCTVSGTSASTPVMAGITARVANQLGTPLGWINPLLYKNGDKFVDITQGENSSGRSSNGPCKGQEEGTIVGFPALPGWDATSGLGSIAQENGYEIYKAVLSGKL